MATGKKFYWFKLKDTFLTSDAVDMLMEQPNGSNYVVLYQILCIKTINTGGRLERCVGTVRIKYDAEKIARDSKWFSVNTVKNALKLYRALGLLKEDKDGVLFIVDYENLVGIETDAASRMRALRSRQDETDGKHCANNVTQDVTPKNEQCAQNVTPDIRDEILENRSKILENRDDHTTTTTDLDTDSACAHTQEEAPTVAEVYAYFKTELCIDDPGNEAEKFVAYNDYHDWICLPDWKKAANLWAARSGERKV